MPVIMRHAGTDCRNLCRDQVVADKADCAVDRAACHAVCETAADRRCADTVCGPAYEDCRVAVTQATRACIIAAGNDGAAIQACVEPGDAVLGIGRAALEQCLTDPADGLMTCIAGC